jgi:endonuclease-8
VPEGDTVHRWANRLHAALAGHPVRRFELRRDPRGVRLPPPGTVVEAVEARGKHLLVRFADGTTLHTHMRLQGAWHLYEPGERWKRPAHTARVVLELEDGTQAVCFDAPVVELRRERVELGHLGPDLCAEGIDLATVIARLDTLPETTEIGEALLDQRVAAGIGNVFKSEVCWARRVHPRTLVRDLDTPARQALYETARTQLRANLGSGPRVTFRGGLAVYRKARRPCPRCRTPIRRDFAGNEDRVTYWCPTCQPAP